MAEVTLHLLGEPRVCVDGVPRPCRAQGLRLLAVLALDGPGERLTLADRLWDTTTTRALHNLRMTVYHLTATLGGHADVLRRRAQFLNLNLQRVEVDALCIPVTPGALLEYWQGFLAGHRTRGTEAWLDWAQHTERRLLAEHVEHLRQVACTTPEPMAIRLRRRAGQLSGDLAGHHAAGIPRPVPGRQHPLPEEPTHPPPALLVGREQVLEDVLAAVERRQMVFLSGSPGMGKSALQAAVALRVGGQVILPVPSDPTDRAGPYTTIYRALRDLQQGLNLGRWPLPDLRGQDVEPHLAQLPDVRHAGSVDPVARPLLAEAFQQPFISWGDDIHHWDDASTRVVARHSPYLLAHSPHAGVINTYRPGELSAGCRHGVLHCTDHGRGVIIPLRPLTREQVAALSEHFLPGVTDAQVGHLHHYAGGVPGMLVPVLQEAARRGGLPGDLTRGAAPDARQHLELTLLGPRELELLRVLAVNAGELLDLPTLGDVLGWARPTVVDTLETLFQRGYVAGDTVHPPALRMTVLRHAPPLMLADLASRLRAARAARPVTPPHSELTVN